jgi:tRNA-binding protein
VNKRVLYAYRGYCGYFNDPAPRARVAIFNILALENSSLSMITWNDFEKLDIRTGTIIDVQDFPEARNPAWKLTIDFGALGIKRSSAQITKLYGKNDLNGKQVIAIINFPPKQVGPFISECLVMGVVGDDKEVVLLQPERRVENGRKIG